MQRIIALLIEIKIEAIVFRDKIKYKLIIKIMVDKGEVV